MSLLNNVSGELLFVGLASCVGLCLQFFTAFECGEVSVSPFTPKVVSVAIRSTRNFGRSFPISTVSIQLKHTQVSPTSIGTRQCITTSSRCLQLICSIGSYSTTLFSARLALATGGQCGYQIDAKFWSQSTAGRPLYRGAWEARPEGSTGGFYRGVLPRGARYISKNREGSTGGSMEGSTGGLDRGVLPRGSIHINVYYNEATGDRYVPTRFSWTSTWKPWTAFVWDRSDKCSGQTTLCSDIRALATNWRRDTASFIWTRLSYQELTTLLLHDTIKQCWEFHNLGGEQRPSRVLGSSDFGLGVFLCLVSSWCLFLFCRSSLFRALGVFCVFFGFTFFVVFGLTYFCDGGRKPSFAYLELEIAMST